MTDAIKPGAPLVFGPARERANDDAGRNDDPERAGEGEHRVRAGQHHHEAAQAGRPGEPDDGAEQDEPDAAQGQAASSRSRARVRRATSGDRALASHILSGLCEDGLCYQPALPDQACAYSRGVLDSERVAAPLPGWRMHREDHRVSGPVVRPIPAAL